VSAPATIVGLEIEHRTSEDWLLHLPLRIGASDATTATALAGAQAQLRLKGKRPDQTPSEILFSGSSCRIEQHEIVLEAPSEHFTGKDGIYKGELLVRLANGFDFVSHVVDLKVLDGLGWVP
jgi:hypothetical protein